VNCRSSARHLPYQETVDLHNHLGVVGLAENRDQIRTARSRYNPASGKQEKVASVKMASTSFRDSMNSLGWSRRDTDIPANTNSSVPILSKISSLNPFGRSGYVQLPTHEAPGAPPPAPSRREEEEGWYTRTFHPELVLHSLIHQCHTPPFTISGHADILP
jgi:hypothetical protein